LKTEEARGRLGKLHSEELKWAKKTRNSEMGETSDTLWRDETFTLFLGISGKKRPFGKVWRKWKDYSLSIWILLHTDRTSIW
jgi:hypothetical protein